MPSVLFIANAHACKQNFYLPVPEDIGFNNYLGTELLSRTGAGISYTTGPYTTGVNTVRLPGFDAPNYKGMLEKTGAWGLSSNEIKSKQEENIAFAFQAIGVDRHGRNVPPDAQLHRMLANNPEVVLRNKQWLDLVRLFANKYGWSRVGPDIIRSVHEANTIVQMADTDNEQGPNPVVESQDTDNNEQNV
jgi:hypothetical protein